MQNKLNKNIRVESMMEIKKFYEIESEIIGKGSFGLVYKARNIRCNDFWAIKIVDKRAVIIYG